ncbi:MAG: hypothetical protein HYV01_04155 [Deltaproteobacteria bacterium]|nr:hypothetical protein [Deltaproteobacteria bacterium]
MMTSLKFLVEINHTQQEKIAPRAKHALSNAEGDANKQKFEARNSKQIQIFRNLNVPNKTDQRQRFEFSEFEI